MLGPMRGIQSRLAGFALAAFIGTCAVVGCSASGDPSGGPGTDLDPTAPQATGPSGSPIQPSDFDDAGPDDQETPAASPKKDGGKSDGGPPPQSQEGDPCPTPNKAVKRSCGKCGWQEAMCQAKDGGSKGVLGPFNPDCRDEITAGCMPGTSESTTCGNCGTQTRTCNNSCQWASTACVQPTNSCTPGAIEMMSAGCPADQFQSRLCTASCTWENYTGACAPPPAFVNAPPTIGSTNWTLAILTKDRVGLRLPANSGTHHPCPITATWPASGTIETPYTYVEVRNPNPKPVTVSVYNSIGPSNYAFDTMLAAYEGSAIPSTESERKQCKGQYSTWGNQALTLDATTKFASLDGSQKAVIIAARSSVQIYVASELAYDSANPKLSTGVVKLVVRTEAFAP